VVVLVVVEVVVVVLGYGVVAAVGRDAVGKLLAEIVV